MTEDVFRPDGTSDKFLGDAVMVCWSAPIEQPNHAQVGLRCALAMGKQMKTTNKKSAAEWKEPFTPQISLHTRTVVVENMGAKGLKIGYTAIGTTVNLAVWIEGTVKQYSLT